MVEANQTNTGPRRAHFDEDELNEYDKQRGKCMKIDDPKTPFHDDSEEDTQMIEVNAVAEPEDPIV